MKTTDNLLSLWNAQRQNLQAIAEYNLKAAQTLTEIMRSEELRIKNHILIDYRHKLNAAETRHRHARLEFQQELRKLNRTKGSHRIHCSNIATYSRAVALSPLAVRKMWAAFIYLGSQSPLLPGSNVLFQPVPVAARSADQYYSPARKMSPVDPLPPIVQRSGEAVEWLRAWGLVPIGNTPASEWVDGMVKEFEKFAQVTIEAIAKRIESLQAKRNELDAKHFLETRKIPESIMPKSK